MQAGGRNTRYDTNGLVVFVSVVFVVFVVNPFVASYTRAELLSARTSFLVSRQDGGGVATSRMYRAERLMPSHPKQQ